MGSGIKKFSSKMSKQASKWTIGVPEEGIVEIRYKDGVSPAEDLYSFSKKVHVLEGDFCKVDPNTGKQAYFYCLRCKCSCSSPKNLQDHLNGNKHNKGDGRLTRKEKIKAKIARNSVGNWEPKNTLEPQQPDEVNIQGHVEDGEETDDNFIVDEGTGAAGWPLMRVKEAVFLKELLWGDNLPECLLVFGLHDTGKSTVQGCIFLPKVIFLRPPSEKPSSTKLDVFYTLCRGGGGRTHV